MDLGPQDLQFIVNGLTDMADHLRRAALKEEHNVSSVRRLYFAGLADRYDALASRFLVLGEYATEGVTLALAVPSEEAAK